MGVLGKYQTYSRCLSPGNYHSSIFEAKPGSILVHGQFVLLVTSDTLASMSGVTLGHRWGFSVSLPQEVRVTLELGVEEVTMPFGSCHQDLGGKTALGHLQSLVSARTVEGSSREPWEQRRAGKPGGPRKLPAWLAGGKGADENVRALEGIGFLPPPAALSCLCCFPEGPNYNPLVESGLPEILQR